MPSLRKNKWKTTNLRTAFWNQISIHSKKQRVDFIEFSNCLFSQHIYNSCPCNFFLTASLCSVSYLVTLISMSWKKQTVSWVQRISFSTCFSYSSCCSTCSWPSSTTHTLKSRQISLHRRASSKWPTTLNGFVDFFCFFPHYFWFTDIIKFSVKKHY